MAGFNIESMKTLPGLLKPILFVILLVYLILMAASYYGPGWWIWFTLILQFVFIILINVFTLFGLETVLTTRRQWTIFEIIYSGIFAVLSTANTIVQITLLIRHHSSLFGVAALICFGLVLLYGLNCMMMFKIWRQDGISSQSPGPGIRPGNTGSMHPGLGSALGAFPGAVPPATNTSYPPAIPPGATLPSNTTSLDCEVVQLSRFGYLSKREGYRFGYESPLWETAAEEEPKLRSRMGNYDRRMAIRAPDATVSKIAAASVESVTDLNEDSSQDALSSLREALGVVGDCEEEISLHSSENVPLEVHDVALKKSPRNPFDWKELYQMSDSSDSEDGDQLLLGKEYTMSVRMRDAFPIRASKKALRHVIRNSENERMIKQIKDLFDVRPMWTRFALKQCTGFTSLQIKLVVKNHAFYIIDGPWAHSWCRFGYDPRRSPDAKAYQTIKVNFGRYLRKYLEQGLKLDADKTDTACAVTEVESKSSGYSGKSSDSQVSISGDEHLYVSGRAPCFPKMLYSICDIALPTAYATIEEKNTWMPRGRADDKYGWLLPGAVDDIKRAIEEDFYALIQDFKVTDELKEDRESEEETNQNLGEQGGKSSDDQLQTLADQDTKRNVGSNVPAADGRKDINRNASMGTAGLKEDKESELTTKEVDVLLGLISTEEGKELASGGYEKLGESVYEICNTLGLCDWEAPGARIQGCGSRDTEVLARNLHTNGSDCNNPLVTSCVAGQHDESEPSCRNSLEANKFLTGQEAGSAKAFEMREHVEHQGEFDTCASSFNNSDVSVEDFSRIIAELDKLLDE